MKCQGVLLTSLKISDVYYPSFKLFSQNTRRCYSTPHKRNPYDVLGVKNTCSTRDVKKAYIKLCKELHPDMKPGDTSQHMKFVELNNAYNVLANAESRKRFDNQPPDTSSSASSSSSSASSSSSSNDFASKHNQTSYPFNQYTRQKDKQWFEREEYWQQFNQRPSRTYQPLNYKWSLIGCFVLVVVGSVLLLSAYRYATRYTFNIVDKKSKKISEDYNELREKTLSGGKEEKVAELKKKWNV